MCAVQVEGRLPGVVRSCSPPGLVRIERQNVDSRCLRPGATADGGPRRAASRGASGVQFGFRHRSPSLPPAHGRSEGPAIAGFTRAAGLGALVLKAQMRGSRAVSRAAALLVLLLGSASVRVHLVPYARQQTRSATPLLGGHVHALGERLRSQTPAAARAAKAVRFAPARCAVRRRATWPMSSARPGAEPPPTVLSASRRRPRSARSRSPCWTFPGRLVSAVVRAAGRNW